MFFSEGYEFGNLILQERVMQNITQEELGEGLYTATLISKIERGEFCPNRLLRDRLLERLGETSYDYETYMEKVDYVEWNMQNRLLCTLESEQFYEAESLLQQYKEQYEEKCVVSKQFYLAMYLQWLERINENTEKKSEEYVSILEQAVKLTIPNIDQKSIQQLVLSPSELNLVLEYIPYEKPKKLKKRYEELFQYMEQKTFDLESRALIDSKLALYFCKYQLEQIEQRKQKKKETIISLLQKALQVCTKGIESLRNHEKVYFAFELLEKKQKILASLLEEEWILSFAQIEQYKKEQEEAKTFFKVLNRLYETYHIPKKTNNYTIFYRRMELYCINDVIRARRKMFQIAPKQLEDICSIRTIRRIENNTFDTQKYIVKQLFHRVHLSIELQHSLIVTKNKKAIHLEKSLRTTINQREYEKAKELVKQLKEMISMKQQINKQYIEYIEVCLAYETKEIEKEEFIQRAIAILEYTMPLKVALRPFGIIQYSNGRTQLEEKYFTNMEITIMYNVAQELKGKEKEQYFLILQQYFEKLEQKVGLPSILGMYGLVMSAIASDMGNQGNYEDSIEINKKMIQQSLQLRHLEYVEKNMYGLMWNEEKIKGLPEKENHERILCMKDCITIDNYNKNKRRENWMRNRLNKILDN